MDTYLIEPYIQILRTCSAEQVSLILFFTCAISLLLMFRFFGLQGLYLYNIVAILATNIQVLCGAKFNFVSEPVALGTIVFTSTYLCSDLITEHYGKEYAKQGIWYCFAAQILMTVLMIVALGYPSLSSLAASVTFPTSSDASTSMIAAENAMAILFTPSPRLLIASLFAFVISQLNDIWIFHWLNKLTRSKWLWLRTIVSGCNSAIIDTLLFSVLAWVILAPEPLSYKTLFFTYILSTWVARMILSVFSTPIMYLSYLFKPVKLRYAA